MFGVKISQLGKLPEDRVDPDLIDGALDYIQYDEEPLAFEILCDHISEYDITITENEYELITQLIEEMKLDVSEPPFKYLKKISWLSKSQPSKAVIFRPSAAAQ